MPYPQQSGQGNYQQYSQYYQRASPQAYSSDDKPHKKKILLLTTGAAIILIISGAFVFDLLKQPEEKTQEDQLPPLQGIDLPLDGLEDITSITLTDLEFCKSIDEDYNCEQTEDGAFNKGDTLWMLARVRGFEQLQN